MAIIYITPEQFNLGAEKNRPFFKRRITAMSLLQPLEAVLYNALHKSQLPLSLTAMGFRGRKTGKLDTSL